jgi:hypothetical protein
LLYPAFRTPHLFGGISYGSLVPAAPIFLQVARAREFTVFVTKNDDVILENNEKIADLLPIALASGPALVAKNSGITPQWEERTFAQLS